MFTDDCIKATLRFMRQNEFDGLVNIGLEAMITINELAQMAIDSSAKKVSIKKLTGDGFLSVYGFECPVGERGRNSHDKLYREKCTGRLSVR